MSESQFQPWIDRAASAVSRRASLVALAAAAIKAAVPLPATAKNKHRNKNNNSAIKKARRNAKKKCQQQVDECNVSFADNCAGFTDPASCQAQVATCCELFGSCSALEALDCLQTIRDPAP
jgi:hypothetical protein